MSALAAEARVDSVLFAQAANNALAFLPANSQVKLARMRLTPDGVEFTATDTYAAGRDAATVHDFQGDDITVMVDRAALQGFDSAGRKDRKGIGVVSVFNGRVMFAPQDQELATEVHEDYSANASEIVDMFDAIDEMLAESQEFRTAFQPQLLQRFSKVKADKVERVADLAIDDPEAPVLVKIGPTFRGLIMPVSRETHAVNVGEEGLW